MIKQHAQPRMSTQAMADMSPLTHSFEKRLGYFDHRAPPLLPLVRKGLGHEASPPAGTREGSAHLLLPPGGVRPHWHPFTWINGAWHPPLGTGNRLAFTPGYLAAHGWRYHSHAVL